MQTKAAAVFFALHNPARMYLHPMESKARLKERAAAINAQLAQTYPNAKCSLNFRNPFELLSATILSAQCTDERVNMVTPALFKRFPNAKAMAAGDPAEIEELIRTTGFFRNKTKSLKGMAEALTRDHAGKVPNTMEELRPLPGVGRKTANVVLGNCFNTPGITVDTHMSRVTQRLGLTRNADPEKIERDLMEVIPQADWTHFSHRIIDHGRAICQARRPLCEQCPLTRWCAYYQKFQKAGGAAPAARPVKRKP
jgi:endonuclease-3